MIYERETIQRPADCTCGSADDCCDACSAAADKREADEEEAEAVCSVLCQVEGFNYAERVRILQAALRDVETVQELEMAAARGES